MNKKILDLAVPNNVSYHPLNLALRFILEMAALASLAIWGYTNFAPEFKIFTAILAPLLFALIWGIFAVRGDPSRSGKTVVPTPGTIRLMIELILFMLSILSLFVSGYRVLSFIFAAFFLLHYILSAGRIRWLIRQIPKSPPK
jgi:hypothetical protein